MEARFGNGAHHFYSLGKRTLEWDLNDWRWDGDLFLASPVNPLSSNHTNLQAFPSGKGNSPNSSSSCSDEVNLQIEQGRREFDKRRREDQNVKENEAGGLSLKLGGHDLTNEREVGDGERISGKKTKLAGSTTTRALCQVEECGADLSNGKDYHRRHKVCEVHSKATKALVANVMQRFCQQCSRFHVLEEFDEGKRSCRRRLAGHNKRRRKPNPEAVTNGSTLNNDQTSGYLLITLLRILSNMHSNKSEHTTDQNLLSHLLRSLAGHNAEHEGINTPGLLQEHQDLLSSKKSEAVRVNDVGDASAETSPTKTSMANKCPAYSDVQVRRTVGRTNINSFDLNDTYIVPDDGMEDITKSPVHGCTLPLDSRWIQQDSHQFSPPQKSGNSDSASAQSLSSSNGDVQCRTDRIVFKLFGKEPNEFPLVLRRQILDWLSHSPSDIESYIRPGCIILTIYLRQPEAAWQELCDDLRSSLVRLLDLSGDTFWTTGWVFIRVQHQVSFIYNGHVVVDRPLPLKSNNSYKISSITPIAISPSDTVQFLVKGVNLCRHATRLLCAVDGSYVFQEATHDLLDGTDNIKENNDHHSINFSCTIRTHTGRGFIEIEDNGFASCLFPFIVAEEDVCTEIRMLESAIERSETDANVGVIGKVETKDQALDFLHEMGCILHRNQLKFRLGHLNPYADPFSLIRFKGLIEFSMDRDWCAVVKKLLSILLDGTVGAEEHPTLIHALLEMGLLHRAVRRNSRMLVELLLRYIPEKISDKFGSENTVLVGGNNQSCFFRPDVSGPAGLTPVHIAAGKDGSEDVLDALTDDPGMVGIEAWKSARDSTGFTPEDYARLRGHYSYIRLVQRKINKRYITGDVVLNIPSCLVDDKSKVKQKIMAPASFEMGPSKGQCKACDFKRSYGTSGRSLVYRPAMLSMVAIAAVCVCVALLFKSSPKVMDVFRPFRWELLEYGTS